MLKLALFQRWGHAFTLALMATATHPSAAQANAGPTNAIPVTTIQTNTAQASTTQTNTTQTNTTQASPTQASLTRLTCETMATWGSNTTLTYQVAGPVAGPESSGTTPLTLTVLTQTRNGHLQTLIRNAVVQDYRQLAPDADFSRLPFDGEFRAQPNNGDRLYGTPASAHGLYVSLRPMAGQPKQIQIVHYFGAGKFARSTIGTCQTETPATDAAARQLIAQLQTHLQAQNWVEADRLTRRLLAPESATMPPAGPALTDPALIREIDQAWLTASNSRFGLSVQLRLWQAATIAHPTNLEAAVNNFRDRVGWKIAAPRTEQDFISSDWRNESELNRSLQSPVGHLPWAGVSDQVVQRIAVPPPGVHCGSCSIDAIQLRHDRFYTYIPRLMMRLKFALG